MTKCIQNFIFWATFLGLCISWLRANEPKPNIIFILADDLGYGEIEALDPGHAKIPTPSVNRLAEEGMIFTDAHTSSSVCSPTRYNFLTGRYNWRTRLQKFVIGDGEPPLIAKDRKTIGHLFQEQGYQTAIFGKWHLGFQFVLAEGAEKRPKKKGKAKDTDDSYLLSQYPVGSKVLDGPITRGFDQYYGFHHARSMSSVIRGDKIIREDPMVEMLPKLNQEVSEYIDAKAKDAKNGKPFFIFMPLSSPHSPVVPSKKFKGSTKLGDYADFVSQTDHSVGVVLDALDRNGIRGNTIVVFSSDNGSAGFSRQVEKNAPSHRCSGPLRGRKGSLWDGGHRVPFVLSWPAKVKPGSETDQLVCLGDFLATMADLLAVELPDDMGEDSESFLPALFEEPIQNPRKVIVHHDIDGRFSIRQGQWKLLLKSLGANQEQLYNLKEDLGESTNLARNYPKKVKELLALLEEQVANGRSTPGASQKNDVKIDLWKIAGK